jgi:hypothetical protein
MPVCSLCGATAVLVWLKWHDSTNTDLVNVFACANHQISTDIACLTHQHTCTAPNAANLPGCDCNPTNTDVSSFAIHAA